MIRLKTGDIFGEDAEALVNAVNCVGVMGRGLALQFKRRFPDSFGAHAAKRKLRAIQPGRVFVFGTSLLDGPSYIVNFPTKRHWREESRLEDTQSGLKSLEQEIRERGIRSIAIPVLGSGLGGLRWSDVRASMEAALDGRDAVSIAILEPKDAPVRRGRD